MVYNEHINELKELKEICRRVIQRIELIEKMCREQQVEWYRDINKRIAALGFGPKGDHGERDDEV